MRRIQTDDELTRLHEAGEGLIYNDYSGRGPGGAQYNVLHAAGCTWVGESKVSVPKYYFDSISEATEWLASNRGSEGTNWKRCGTCGARVSERGGTGPTSVTSIPNRRQTPMEVSDPFTEGRVEAILIPWLEARDYTVQKQVPVRNGIVDLMAEGPDGRWVIEAKGEDRGGYTSAEMNFQIGVGQIVSRMAKPSQNYALAIPDTPHFRRVLNKFQGTRGFGRLGLTLFVAKERGEVRRVDAADVLAFLDALE